MLIKRIFMNAADQGGGAAPANPAPTPSNGAPAPAPPAPAPASPAQPPAPNGAAPNGIDINALAQAVAAAVTPAVRDSVFAEARRTGMLGGNKSKANPAPAPADGAPTPSAPVADMSRLRSLDRVISRTGLASNLSEAQYARLERDYVAESPDDVEGWVRAYFPGSSGSPAAPAPASPAAQPPAGAAPAPSSTTPPQPANARPASDRGSPPVPAVPLEEQDLFSMSPTDREALRKQKGDKWYVDRIHEQSQNRRIKFR